MKDLGAPAGRQGALQKRPGSCTRRFAARIFWAAIAAQKTKGWDGSRPLRRFELPFK
jgi:hypothetical protein